MEELGDGRWWDFGGRSRAGASYIMAGVEWTPNGGRKGDGARNVDLGGWQWIRRRPIEAQNRGWKRRNGGASQREEGRENSTH